MTAASTITASNTTASNAVEFCQGVMPRAELSLAMSQIAKERARQANTIEFVGLELEEADTVISLLKGLGISPITLDARAEEALQKIENASPGAEFDRAYMTAQLINHEGLYLLADNYLNTSVDARDDAEMQGRRLATLARFAFKEHVVLCTRISHELQ